MPQTSHSDQTRMPVENDRAVQVWLLLVAGLVLAMIGVGGATRLTDSGLSITEWLPILGAIPPLSDADWIAAFRKYQQIPEYKLVNEGMTLDAFKYIYWWEWAHRFLGRFIGVAFGLPLLIFWFIGRLRADYRWKLLGVLFLGGMQGFFGWYMVQSGLADRVDVSHYRLGLHLTAAFVIFALLLWLALDLSPRRTVGGGVIVSNRQICVGFLLIGLFFLQSVVGAFVAGTKAGLVYNSWPLMDGAWVPDGLLQMSPWYLNFVENVTTIQFVHRIVAYAMILTAVTHAGVLWVAQGRSYLTNSGLLLVFALLCQAGLGIWTLLSAPAAGQIPITLGLMHQIGAALVLAVLIWHVHSVLGARISGNKRAGDEVRAR